MGVNRYVSLAKVTTKLQSKGQMNINSEIVKKFDIFFFKAQGTSRNDFSIKYYFIIFF